jgi:hypothetical protein
LELLEIASLAQAGGPSAHIHDKINRTGEALMRRTKTNRALLAVSIALLGLAALQMNPTLAELAVPAREIPTFQVDPSWPMMPSKWSLGPVSGLTVDSNDHVWVITRPREVMRPVEGKPAAPPIMEFDAAGNFLQGWGGPGQGYEWPAAEHGVTVDSKGFVWIAGRGKDDNQILKFTRDG